MKKIVIIAILLSSVFMGCATMERFPGGSLQTSKYAPVNQAQQNGLISYDVGYESTAREDAYKQMHTSCRGKYKIINEESKNGGYVTLPMYGGASHTSRVRKTYITFKCY